MVKFNWKTSKELYQSFAFLYTHFLLMSKLKLLTIPMEYTQKEFYSHLSSILGLLSESDGFLYLQRKPKLLPITFITTADTAGGTATIGEEKWEVAKTTPKEEFCMPTCKCQSMKIIDWYYHKLLPLQINWRHCLITIFFFFFLSKTEITIFFIRLRHSISILKEKKLKTWNEV